MAFQYSKYAAFKQQWRAACKEHDIDPEHGPTSYQVAAVKAAMVEQQRRRQAAEQRWASPEALETWRQWGAISGRIFDMEPSDLERAIIGHIRRQAERINLPEAESYDEVPCDLPTIAELWREVKSEMAKEDISRREWMRLQATSELVLSLTNAMA